MILCTIRVGYPMVGGGWGCGWGGGGCSVVMYTPPPPLHGSSSSAGRKKKEKEGSEAGMSQTDTLRVDSQHCE